jgi:hypothetical protein
MGTAWSDDHWPESEPLASGDPRINDGRCAWRKEVTMELKVEMEMEMEMRCMDHE